MRLLNFYEILWKVLRARCGAVEISVEKVDMVKTVEKNILSTVANTKKVFIIDTYSNDIIIHVFRYALLFKYNHASDFNTVDLKIE